MLSNQLTSVILYWSYVVQAHTVSSKMVEFAIEVKMLLAHERGVCVGSNIIDMVFPP